MTLRPAMWRGNLVILLTTLSACGPVSRPIPASSAAVGRSSAEGPTLNPITTTQVDYERECMALTGREPECPPSTTDCCEPSGECCRSHSDPGRVFFEEERYEAALSCFALSFRLDPRPRVAYNVGRTRERLDQPARARACYELVLQLAGPEGGWLRTEARGRLDQLERLRSGGRTRPQR